MVSVPVLLLLSVTVTVITFAPEESEMPVLLQDVVPVAEPDPLRSLLQATDETDTLSLDVPLKSIVLELVLYVAPLVGLVIVTAGSVVSPPPASYSKAPISQVPSAPRVTPLRSIEYAPSNDVPLFLGRLADTVEMMR